MILDLTPEELSHIETRRLTQELWESFTQEKCPMSWYKENTPTVSPFVRRYEEWTSQ